MKTGDISVFSDRGKHITTHRELHVLKNGGIIIDTPGMKVFQSWGETEGVSRTFGDVDELAAMWLYLRYGRF